MKIKAVLFDLDGTLLPMDQELFVKAYMGGLVRVAASLGYEAGAVANGILAGTAAMVKNDGKITNEELFWQVLAERVGKSILDRREIFDGFYRTEFQEIKAVCGFEPRAKELVDFVKSRGLRVALATNPLFPSVATESRIGWAGLEPSAFELFTSYETSRHCKPNLDYYRDVLSAMNLSAEECLMVGNDVGEDMIAKELGMRVFLLDGCVINRGGEDISEYPGGTISDLIKFIDKVSC